MVTSSHHYIIMMTSWVAPCSDLGGFSSGEVDIAADHGIGVHAIEQTGGQELTEALQSKAGEGRGGEGRRREDGEKEGRGGVGREGGEE